MGSVTGAQVGQVEVDVKTKRGKERMELDKEGAKKEKMKIIKPG